MTSSVLYGHAFLPYLKATSYNKGSSTFLTLDLGALVPCHYCQITSSSYALSRSLLVLPSLP